jgi:tRNA modification GTPase
MPPSFPKIDLTQTVCAIATPPGTGGLGIVRVSGPEAIPIADRLFRGRIRLLEQPGFSVHHGYFIDPSLSHDIDEVLATLFRSPKSFTSEDLVEFSAHGGRVVLETMIDVLIRNGANLAVAGEFTLRAFLNGRIDLTEAEAIADLISAKTEESAAAALRQLKGGLLAEVQKLRQDALAALASLEIGIDFTEEDIGESLRGDVAARLATLVRRIESLLSGYQRGRILRDGFTVVLAGPPNVGKSTLFNRLAQDERAIVTDIPGTTRDVLREYVNLNGWPVCIVDTAGMRDSTDLIEQIGIKRTSEAVGRADGIIWLIDSRGDLRPQLPPCAITDANTPSLICLNKTDAVPNPEVIVDQVIMEFSRETSSPSKSPIIGISAKTGQGIEDLLRHVNRWIADCGIERKASELAINNRHSACLKVALESICSASSAVASGSDVELIAFDVKNAASALGEIIGETTTEDVLGEIFSNFCVGK